MAKKTPWHNPSLFMTSNAPIKHIPVKAKQTAIVAPQVASSAVNISKLPVPTYRTITPAIAQQLLAKNISTNRTIKKGRVAQYVQLMTTGRWMPTHQGIAISTNNQLIDGQHRMLAVIQANIPVVMLVTQHVPQDYFKYIDVGAKRTIDQALQIQKALAVGAKAIARLAFGCSNVQANTARVIAAYQTQILEFTQGRSMSQKTIGCANVIAVAMYNILSGNISSQDARDYHSIMCKHQQQGIPPAAQYFMAQCDSGILNASQNREGALLFKAGVAFDDNRNHVSRVTCGPAACLAYANKVKTYFRTNIK